MTSQHKQSLISQLNLFILFFSLLMFAGCSNSLTTRSENQTVQSIDEAFPDVDGDVGSADAESEDMSDESFDDAEIADSGESLEFDDEASDSESTEDFDNMAEGTESSESTEDTTVAQNELDIQDDELDLGDDTAAVTNPSTPDNLVTPDAGQSADPFAEFSEEADQSLALNDADLDTETLEDDLDTEDLGTDETTPADQTLSDMLNSDPALNSDSLEGPVADFEALDEPTDSTSKSQDKAFEEALDQDFADVLDEPIKDEVITAVDESAPNKLTVLEYNAQTTDGVIVIKAEKPLEFATQYDPTSSQFILNLSNVTVPSILQRPLYLKDFKHSFGAIKATPVSGGLVQVVIKVNNNQEPNILTNGKDLIVSPGTDNIAGKVSKVAEDLALDPNVNVESQISRNLNIPMRPNANGVQALTASSLEEFLLETGTFYGDPINLQVNEEEIGTVIGFIADYSGANIVISPGITGKITLKLRNVPWDQALLTIMKTKGLGYVRTGNVLRIAPLEDLQKEALAAVEVRKSQIQIEPTVLKIIPLEYASSAEILPQVTPFLTKERGTATEDKRTSSIVLNDTRTVIEKVSRLIKELDLPPPQVLVEAKIVEATKQFAQSIGVRWGASGSVTQVAPTGGFQNQPISISPRLLVNGTTSAGSLTSNQPLVGSINFGVLDFFGSIDATIGLSESDDQLRVISSPRVTTLNNVEAVITQSSEIIRLQSIITNGVAQITPVAVPIVLQLKVTPQITSGSSVLMQLDVKNEFPGVAVEGQSPKNTRQAVAKVLVETNKTAVIGGIYDKKSSVSNIGVPILKNIPFLGWLFKTKAIEKSDSEIMMFITPRILDKQYQTSSSSKVL